jgi:hypothetical protein
MCVHGCFLAMLTSKFESQHAYFDGRKSSSRSCLACCLFPSGVDCSGVEKMERVPTRTDLERLCDAADSIVHHYEYNITRFGSTVERWDWELDQFANIVRLLPYPPHYFTPFGVENVDWWCSRNEWQGWTDASYDAFVNLACLVRNLHLHWLDLKGDANAKQPIKASDPKVKEAIEAISQDMARLRATLVSPMPFNLMPDAKSLSLYRDEPNYKDNVARLGDWFPVVSAICTSNGRFLSHDDTEKAFTAAGIKGAYDPSFRVALSRRINDDLKTLGVEIVAVRGKGWKLELFHQTLP